MATILTKRSNTASSVPSGAALTNSSSGAELAVNTADKRLFVKDSGGTVQEVGTNPSSLNVVGNATVGGTLGVTGVATLTSNPVLSGGTANGVPYLNGSKVLTSGSALQFDGTNFSVGGSNGSAHKLNLVIPVFATNASGGMRMGDSGNNYFVDQLITTDGSANPFFTLKFASHTLSQYGYGGAGNYWAWFANNAEGMRLTSTGLGIGTSSITAKLNVAGTIESSIASTSYNWLAVSNTGQTAYFGVDSSSGAVWGAGNYTLNIRRSNGTNLVFGTASATQATLDSSGNLGLGVTPSAWSGYGLPVFELPNYGTIVAAGENATFGANWYYSSGFKYKTTAAASYYYQQSGSHAWYTAPYGTAGAAITFTQAMTLDASGNWLLGATSAVGAGAVQAQVGSSSQLTSGFMVKSSTSRLSMYASSTSAAYQAWASGTVMIFGEAPDNLGTFTERARIDASGRLLINTSSPVNSSTGALQVLATSASNGAVTAAQPNSASGTSYTSQSVTAAGTGWYHFVGQSGNGSTITTNNIFIYGNGNVQNTNNSYGAISDLKLKENITDATPKLDGLMQVRVVNYNLKSDPAHKQLGVIAQELEQVFPGMIEETQDRDAEGNDLGTTTKGVKYSVFVPMLIKAMQELKAEFDAYKAAHP